MSAWQSAIETALVGVAHKPWEVPPTEEELATVLQRSQTDEAALSLLHSLAVLSVYRKAGEMPILHSAPAHSAAPEETLPVCGPRVASHLHAMLSGQFADLLPWTIERLVEVQQRVPAELLPSLLNRGSAHLTYRESLRQICGERGKWLADINSAWNWLLATDLTQAKLWETGSASQRFAFLQQLRRTDPDRTRDLLESVWSQEKAEQRAQFLQALRERLSSRDEAFLESRLDDRSLAVRQAAAELLSCIPHSAYLQRMQKRLLALVRIERKFFRVRPIQVILPDNEDPAILRDGIKGQNTPGGLGEKASALMQMIGAVPPRFWSDQFHLGPAQFFKAAAAGEWKDSLWRGWQEAIKRHRDASWARALVDLLPFESLDMEILMLLAPAERESICLRSLREQPHTALYRFIPRFPPPWSLPFTQAVLEKCLAADDKVLLLANTLRAALAKMPPDTARLITPQWPASLSEFAAGLEFFQMLHSDLQNHL